MRTYSYHSDCYRYVMHSSKSVNLYYSYIKEHQKQPGHSSTDEELTSSCIAVHEQVSMFTQKGKNESMQW